MLVVIIRENDGSLNVIGPFWGETAAKAFVETLPSTAKAEVHSATDREKFRTDD